MGPPLCDALRIVPGGPGPAGSQARIQGQAGAREAKLHGEDCSSTTAPFRTRKFSPQNQMARREVIFYSNAFIHVLSQRIFFIRNFMHNPNTHGSRWNYR